MDDSPLFKEISALTNEARIALSIFRRCIDRLDELGAEPNLTYSDRGPIIPVSVVVKFTKEF